MTADFDAVIVAYNSRDAICPAVQAVRGVAGVGDIVVVDHGSDGSGVAAEGAGATVLCDPSNPGFGAGQNRGVRATSAPFVLLLNPDAAPDPGGIRSGLATLRGDAHVAAAQGVIMNRGTRRPERSQGRELTPLHLLGRALGARRLLAARPVRFLARRWSTLADHVDRVPEHANVVESLAATALLVRRSAFDAVGGFDEAFFLYGEDLDLCRRLRRAGWNLVALPETMAWHDGGASSHDSLERELSWWRGTMRYSATWWSRNDWALALVAATIQWLRLAFAHPAAIGRSFAELVAKPLADRRVPE